MFAGFHISDRCILRELLSGMVGYRNSSGKVCYREICWFQFIAHSEAEFVNTFHSRFDSGCSRLESIYKRLIIIYGNFYVSQCTGNVGGNLFACLYRYLLATGIVRNIKSRFGTIEPVGRSFYGIGSCFQADLLSRQGFPVVGTFYDSSFAIEYLQSNLFRVIICGDTGIYVGISSYFNTEITDVVI